MPVKKDDAHRALELLEDYCARLTSPNDKQLRIAIEKLIYIFKSSLFQALLDIQEFYEAILLDDTKDANSKALAVLRIADKWLENTPMPGQDFATRNGLVVQADGSDPLNKPNSPSFNSNLSVDANGAINSPDGRNMELLTDDATLQKLYQDHWILENIVLERVSYFELYVI